MSLWPRVAFVLHDVIHNQQIACTSRSPFFLFYISGYQFIYIYEKRTRDRCIGDLLVCDPVVKYKSEPRS